MRVCWVVRLLLQLGLTSWNPIRFVLVKTKMFPSFFKAAKISIIILIFGNCSKICVNWFFKVDFLSSLHKGISPEDFWEVWKNIPICRKSLNNFQKINRSVFKPIFDLSKKIAYKSCFRLLKDDEDVKKKPRSRNLKYKNWRVKLN